MVLEIKDSEHLKAQLAEAGKKLVVIDFMAAMSGAFQMIGPKFEELSQEFSDVVFLKVDVGKCQDIATEYEITSSPTFIFIKRGKKVESFSELNADRIKNTIQKLK